VFSLKNRLKKKPLLKLRLQFPFLKNWEANALNDETSINDYTCHWVQQVCESTVLFVYKIDGARIILNKNLLKEKDIKSIQKT